MKFRVSNTHRSLPLAVMTFVLCAALLFSQVACSSSSLIKNADRVATSLIQAQPVFQSLVDGGVIPYERGVQIISRLTQGAADAKLLADAFRNGDNTSAIDTAAKLINVLETLISQDAQLIKNPAQRTTALAILAAADIALHVIADNLVQTAQAYPDLDRYITAFAPQSKTAVETIKRFAKKPKLRCRDAKTGRFLKMEQCKAHPDTTVVERF